VEYRRWAPLYERIRREFGFPWGRERRAAARLLRRLPPAARRDPLGRVAARIQGRDAIIAGLAPGAGAPPLWRLPPTASPPVLLAADGATAACLAAGLVPAIVVTDLDGAVASEVAANGRGSLVVVHAHGDNLPAVEEWVPQFPGELAGSWAGPPGRGLLNVGGFTDGDRAAYLAEAAGARRILLWGFAFDRVEAVGLEDRGRKLAKLAWARRLLGRLAREGHAAVLLWQGDGTLAPLPPEETSPAVMAPPRTPRRPRSRRSGGTARPRTRRSPPG
jgi:2-amino-4-hydroxy-6-hydroxymethyldihydropteridine diphosphokinase